VSAPATPACRKAALPRRGDLVLTPRGLRYRGRTYPCAIGRSGITADKREGDCATPAGRHRITGLLWRPDRLPRPATWAKAIGPRDLWSDDPADPAYNRPVRAPHPFSHERLRRADPLYDLVLLTDWNAEGVPGRGSAIFVHRWRKPRHPTAGCLALARADLRRLAALLRPGTRLVVPERR
jgi:L,D-peptidoglycan transpeptidase YkuD (ErfK/YbiS/YcfS/YnhG family)